MAILLVATSCGQLALVASFWSSAAEEQILSLRSGLAQEIAAQIQPHIAPDGTIDLPAVQQIANSFQSYNADITIYLIGPDGSILLDLSDGAQAVRNAVDIEPIRIQQSERSPSLVRGTDPATPKGTIAFFSAPLRIGELAGHLYVTLSGSRAGFIRTLLLEQMSFRYVALGFGLIVLSGLLIAALVARLITVRFERIVSVLERYSQGERSARVPDTKSDEVGAVGTAFNSMASVIERHVTELEEKDTLRRELILNVWHDLRSPLGVIGAQIQLLGMNESRYDSERRLASYNRIEKSSSILNKMLEELHDLAKLETKETVPRLESCSAAELLDDMRSIYGARVEAAGLVLRIECATGLAAVRCDPHLITRVLGNLIENAIRYTPPGGTICLQGTAAENGVRISIVDTGAGISSSALGRIFERHFQETNESGGLPGASGLGLAIVKRIIEAHGSEIHAASVAGEGATFSFILPFYREATGEFAPT